MIDVLSFMADTPLDIGDTRHTRRRYETLQQHEESLTTRRINLEQYKTRLDPDNICTDRQIPLLSRKGSDQHNSTFIVPSSFDESWERQVQNRFKKKSASKARVRSWVPKVGINTNTHYTLVFWLLCPFYDLNSKVQFLEPRLRMNINILSAKK